MKIPGKPRALSHILRMLPNVNPSVLITAPDPAEAASPGDLNSGHLHNNCFKLLLEHSQMNLSTLNIFSCRNKFLSLLRISSVQVRNLVPCQHPADFLPLPWFSEWWAVSTTSRNSCW